MSYDPTQRVPLPGGAYPPQQYTPSGYVPSPQPDQAASAYTPPPPAPVTYTQYNAAPIAPTAAAGGFDFSSFWKSLGLTGQAAGVGGVVAFLCFLFPWITIGGDTFNGFSTASGGTSLDFFGVRGDNTFPFVWLIFLGMLGLVAMTWLLSQRRWFSRLICAGIISAIAGVMLALELCFVIEAGSLSKAANDGAGAGFWLDFITTLAVLSVAIYGVVQERKLLRGGGVNPYQPFAYPPPAATTISPAPPYQHPRQQPPPYQYPNQQPPPSPGQ